jgi:hypothetical protein
MEGLAILLQQAHHKEIMVDLVRMEVAETPRPITLLVEVAELEP